MKKFKEFTGRRFNTCLCHPDKPKSRSLSHQSRLHYADWITPWKRYLGSCRKRWCMNCAKMFIFLFLTCACGVLSGWWFWGRFRYSLQDNECCAQVLLHNNKPEKKSFLKVVSHSSSWLFCAKLLHPHVSLEIELHCILFSDMNYLVPGPKGELHIMPGRGWGS